MEELGGGQEQVEGPGEDDDEKPQHEEEGREPEALEVSRPLLPRAPFSDSMLGVRPATGWRQVMEKRKAVERDLEHMDQLRATVIELQEVLEKEREKCRTQEALIEKAKAVLHKHGISMLELEMAADESDEMKVALENLPRLILQPSVYLRDEGVENFFKEMVAAMGTKKPASAVTVVIDSFSYVMRVPKEVKAFPTVGDVMMEVVTGGLCRKRDSSAVHILSDVTSVLHPSKLYLVLGPPLAGKTSLLKAVAGRLRLTGADVETSGRLTFNGDTADSGRFSPQSIAEFVEQIDVNSSMLTVRETLEFSYHCIGQIGGPREVEESYLRAVLDTVDMSDTEKEWIVKHHALDHPKVRTALARQRARLMMTLLGLRECADTVIGEMGRGGISGGQRRRVSLGEMLMGSSSILCLDEISTGLDTASTYDIVLALRSSVKAFGSLGLVSLLQPPPEVFQLFDEVLVMKGGQIAFQGPVSAVEAHFTSLGFVRPELKDVADFVLGVVSEEQQQDVAGASPTTSGPQPQSTDSNSNNNHNDHSPAEAPAGPPPPRTASEFASRYRETDLFLSMDEERQQSAQEPATPHEWKEFETPRAPYKNRWWHEVQHLTWREWRFVVRDKKTLRARLVQSLLLGLLQSTIYWDVHPSAVHTRFGSFYQIMTVTAFRSISSFSATFYRRPLFYKQHAARFFRPSSYCVALTLAQMPVVLADVICCAGFFYWFSNAYNDGMGRGYVLFLANLYVMELSMTQLFHMLVFTLPNLRIGAFIRGLINLYLCLFSGYIVPASEVPGYWVWLMYLNPFYYCFRGLAVSEFLTKRYAHMVVNKSIRHPTAPQSFGHVVLAGRGVLEPYDAFQPVGCVLASLALSLLFSLVMIAGMNRLHYETAQAQQKPTRRRRRRWRRAKAGKKKGQSYENDQSNQFGGGTSLFQVMGSVLSGRSLGGITSPRSTPAPHGGELELIIRSGASSPAHRHDDLEAGSPHPIPLSAPARLPPDSPPPAPPAVVRRRSSVMVRSMTLAFKDVCYSVESGSGDTVDLLHNISAFARSGTITALMGSSGAGKTTLLDVLAGRKTTGKVRGLITLNGQEVTPLMLSRIAGYMEQNGRHSPYCTVQEALEFSATLRLKASTTPQMRHAHVQEVLELLELEDIADDVIGPPLGGINPDQRKRLTIAVELCANPSLLFLDEPTSGLDARAAMEVMSAIKRLAEMGRTIIATIHQPSTQLFTSTFDYLLLLKKGGQLVYFGPTGYNSLNVISYFEAIPGTPRLEHDENPATWMLECLGAGTLGVERANYVDEYKRSALCRKNLSLVERYTKATTEVSEAYRELVLAKRLGIWDTTLACTVRAARSYWRQPAYSVVRMILAAIIALSFGSVYGSQQQTTSRELLSFVAVLYLSNYFMSLISTIGIIPVAYLERQSYLREHASKMYSPGPYSLAFLLAELPYIFVQVWIFSLFFYFSCGYEASATPFFYYVLFQFLNILFANSYGLLLASAFSSEHLTNLVQVSLNPILNVFGGYNILPVDIPDFWQFLYWGTPMHYVLEGMVMTQWHETGRTVEFFEPKTETYYMIDKRDFIQRYFSNAFRYEHRWVNVAILLSMIVASRVGFYLCLKYKVK